MKIKYLIGFVIIIFAAVVFAQDIQYPVTELGNCKSQADCKFYCDRQENTEACVNFAEKNNLMSEEEIQLAKNFMALGSKGPGGCTGKDSCEQYCNDISHIDECISFAVKNNLMPLAELEEAKKVQAAIARGVKPPPCGNKRACDAYCDTPEHMEECITFGAAAGFIQGKELEDAQKMLQAVKRGVKPPPCKGKKACDQYCSQPENMELCMNFAMEAGFMSEQEKADSQKMLQALKKGFKPPNCKGKEECDVYCSEKSHFEECVNFSEAAGFMSAEEAAMARKTGGKGPGGCKGKEECEAFCNNPDNQQTCFDFGKEHGMISEEDLKRIEEGTQMFKQSLEQAPPAVIDCLNSQIGSDVIEKIKTGTMPPSQDVGEKMRKCFETMGPPQGPGGPISPDGSQGGQPPCTDPAGCQQMPGQQQPPPCTDPAACQPPAGQQPIMPPDGQQPFIPPTTPGAGENLPPGEYVPPALPSGETTPPPPSSLLNPNSSLGSVFQIFLKLFSPK